MCLLLFIRKRKTKTKYITEKHICKFAQVGVNYFLFVYLLLLILWYALIHFTFSSFARVVVIMHCRCVSIRNSPSFLLHLGLFIPPIPSPQRCWRTSSRSPSSSFSSLPRWRERRSGWEHPWCCRSLVQHGGRGACWRRRMQQELMKRGGQLLRCAAARGLLGRGRSRCRWRSGSATGRVGLAMTVDGAAGGGPSGRGSSGGGCCCCMPSSGSVPPSFFRRPNSSPQGREGGRGGGGGRKRGGREGGRAGREALVSQGIRQETDRERREKTHGTQQFKRGARSLPPSPSSPPGHGRPQHIPQTKHNKSQQHCDQRACIHPTRMQARRGLVQIIDRKNRATHPKEI